MEHEERSLGMNIVRAGAVVLALSALGYFVTVAQLNARPDAGPPADATEPTATPPSDDAFLPSSKSAPLNPEAFETPRRVAPESKRRAPPKDRFLPSSKSLPFEPEALEPARAKTPAKPRG